MSETEQQLIFREWIEKYRALLFKVIRAYAFNTEDQNDLFQDVCLKCTGPFQISRQSLPSLPGFIALL